MNPPVANITVKVDLTNPGQFFACCGLLELADRLWPGAEGWFSRHYFHIIVQLCSRVACPLPARVEGSIACVTPDAKRNLLTELLTEAKTLTFDVGVDSDSDDSGQEDEDSDVNPIELKWADGTPAIYLNWWSDKSIKPWAGSMKERTILRAMLAAIDPNQQQPFGDFRVVYDPEKPPLPSQDGNTPSKTKLKKREPFYFDPRRGNKSHPLDCGFSPDTHKMEAECCPALEALCFIGLQRARPRATSIANQSRYTVWTKAGEHGLPASLIGPATCGAIPWPSLGTYVFNNYFRTDQRKHKTFSQAMLERINHA